MKRWIRLGYVMPRLAGVLLVLVLLEFGTAGLVRWAIERGGTSLVGARVEVGTARSSFFSTSLTLEDVQVTDPRNPMRNLVAADRLALDFDASALLRKKAIAEHGSLTGLRFGVGARTSGAVPEAPAPDPEQQPSFARSQADRFALGLLEVLQNQLQDELLGELESIRLARELAKRWPEKYQSLEARIGELRQQVRELEDLVRLARSNPLRHAESLQTLPGQASALSQRFGALQAEIEALPGALQENRQAIAAARQHDEQLIREKLHVDSIDATRMTAYLLHDHLAGPLAEVIRWVHWSREVMPSEGDSLEAPRSRGVDVLFAGCRQIPDYLIRELRLEGMARVGGQAVELRGALYDVTSQPRLHGKPVTLALSTSAGFPLHVSGTFDRTGRVPHDQVHLECPAIMLGALELGSAENLRLAVAPGSAAVELSLALEGDALSGSVQLQQQGVELTPTVGPQLARFHLEDPLRQSLGSFRHLSAQVELGGTLDAPTWDVQSNLGPAVASALQLAAGRLVTEQGDRLLERSRQQVDQQLAQLESLVARGERELLPQLTGARQSLRDAVSRSGPAGQALERLGNHNSLLDGLFR